VGRHGLDSSGSEVGPVAGSCEHSYLLVPQKVGNVLTNY